jgi:hypothetical protein
LALPDELQFKVGFPTDQGFFGRQCNSPECHRYFKVDKDSIKPQMHCPYCGVEFSNDQLWTEDQVSYMRQVVAHEVMPSIQEELSNVIRHALSGSKHISFTPSRPTFRPQPQPPAEHQVDSELSCPECQIRFQVDGISLVIVPAAGPRICGYMMPI